MQNSLYLVMIDSFSKFVNVEKITSTTNGQVIQALQATFKFTGYPTFLVTDNATCFPSSEFTQVLINKGIKLIHSPPYHSQSNGLAERTIQSFKHFTAKHSQTTNTHHLFTFHHNFTPLASTLFSPATEVLAYRARSGLGRNFPVLINPDGHEWCEATATGDRTTNTAEVCENDRVFRAHSSRVQRRPRTECTKRSVNTSASTDRPEK